MEQQDYDDIEEVNISSGFDRGIDYEPVKDKLIKHFNTLVQKLHNLDEVDDSAYVRKSNLILGNIIHTIIPMIQLRNGSRICEACNAFIIFCKKGFDKKVTVKIAKSEAIKYKKGKKYVTKARYRNIMFPDWVDISDIENQIIERAKTLPIYRLKKRVLDYLLRYFDCNTHSLRYACINYLIYEKKLPLNTVAKLVGHVGLNQLTTYTQQKNVDKVFDIDM
jgi:integrase